MEIGRHGSRDDFTESLTDLKGKHLQKRTLTAAQATERQVFDVGSQAEGIYLLRVVAGEESKTIRIIKSQ